jgi:hypothetical protein
VDVKNRESGVGMSRRFARFGSRGVGEGRDVRLPGEISPGSTGASADGTPRFPRGALPGVGMTRRVVFRWEETRHRRVVTMDTARRGVLDSISENTSAFSSDGLSPDSSEASANVVARVRVLRGKFSFVGTIRRVVSRREEEGRRRGACRRRVLRRHVFATAGGVR